MKQKKITFEEFSKEKLQHFFFHTEVSFSKEFIDSYGFEDEFPGLMKRFEHTNWTCFDLIDMAKYYDIMIFLTSEGKHFIFPALIYWTIKELNNNDAINKTFMMFEYFCNDLDNINTIYMKNELLKSFSFFSIDELKFIKDWLITISHVLQRKTNVNFSEILIAINNFDKLLIEITSEDEIKEMLGK